MKKLAVVAVPWESRHTASHLVGEDLQMKPWLYKKRLYLTNKHLYLSLREPWRKSSRETCHKSTPKALMWILRGLCQTMQAAAMRKVGARWHLLLSSLKCPLGCGTLGKGWTHPPSVSAFGEKSLKCHRCPKQTETPNIWSEEKKKKLLSFAKH